MVSSSSPVMSTFKSSITSFSSSVKTFSTFCSVSATGLIKVMILKSREDVSIGKDFCLTTFSSLLRRKVNLNQGGRYLLAVLWER